MSGTEVSNDHEFMEVATRPLSRVLGMIRDGEIVDAKTIMLLQYAALNIFGERSSAR